MLCSCICTCSCSCHEKKTIQRNYSFYHCDLKSASCHSRVHFCDISTSESSPRSSVFNTFDFKKLFAPQRRALFDNFQKSSEPEVFGSEPAVFLPVWLRNVLRATMPYTFSTTDLPKVLRTWGACNILTSKCASCRSRGQLFDISTSKSSPRMKCFLAFWLPNLLRATMTCNFWSLLPKWLRTRRFSEPTFRPSGATKHRKDTVFRGFSTFRAPWSCFYWPFLFWLLFSLFLFSASSHLCCFICPYCRKFDF